LVNGVNEIIKSLSPHALPMRTSYEIKPFQNDVVPHERYISAENHKTNEQLPTKKIKNVLGT